MQRKIHLTILCAMLAACTPFDEAEMTERKTFVHFYSSAADYTGTVAELDRDGGFILSGTVQKADGGTDGVIIKTDARGQRIWQKIIPSGIINAILPTESGYIVAGDSVQLNPFSGDVHELNNSFARLITLDANGNVTGKHISSAKIQRSVNSQLFLRASPKVV